MTDTPSRPAPQQEQAAPCDACPWMQKGQPDITPDVREAAESGEWFCCHVNLGTCYGAKMIATRAALNASPPKETTRED